MMVRAPAWIAAWNGRSSRSRSCSSGRSTTGRARWESCAVSPCPGKCFALTATPSASWAATQAAVWALTSSGSPPKLRTPITGLSGFELMSASGAKLRLTPTARSSSATDARDLGGQVEVVDAAEQRVAGIRRAGRVVQARDVAALLVDRDERERVGGTDRVREGADLPARDDVLAEQADPAEAGTQPGGEPLRQLGARRIPGAARLRHRRSSLDRPRGDPRRHPALHDQEEDDDRDRDERRRRP